MVEALKSILFQQKLDRRCKTQGTGAETALLLEHRNRTWDSILVQTNRSILLTGIGVYSPQGGAEKVISVDARPFVDPLRPLDVETKLSSEFEDGSKKAISIFAKVLSQEQGGVVDESRLIGNLKWSSCIRPLAS